TALGVGSSNTGQGGGLFNSTLPSTGATTTLTGVTITSNTASGASGSGGGVFASNGNMSMTFSRIVNNVAAGGGSAATKDSNAGTFTATDNWWGTSKDPATVTGLLSGTIDSSPWLQLKTTASPTSIVVNQTSSLTASFNTDSDNNNVAGKIDVLTALPVSFSGVGGTISGAQPTIQSGGTATATYTGTAANASNSATAVVDNGPSSGSVNT